MKKNLQFFEFNNSYERSGAIAAPLFLLCALRRTLRHKAHIAIQKSTVFFIKY